MTFSSIFSRVSYSVMYFLAALGVLFVNSTYGVMDPGVLMLVLGIMGLAFPFINFENLNFNAPALAAAGFVCVGCFGFIDDAMATAPAAAGTATGMEAAARTVLDLLEGDVATVLGLTAMTTGLIGVAAKFSPGIMAGTAATGVAVAVGPDAIIELAGAAIV